MADLNRILEAVDCELDRSLERLFGLLRIASISTDPAHAADCRRAADWVAADLADLGFEVGVRDTGGHPVVLAHASRRQPPPRAVLRPLRRAAGRSAGAVGHRAVRAAHQPPAATASSTSSPAAPATTRVRCMTFIEACRAYKIATGDAAARRHHADRGRGGDRAPSISRPSSAPSATSSPPTSRWCATPACGTAPPRPSPFAARPGL